MSLAAPPGAPGEREAVSRPRDERSPGAAWLWGILLLALGLRLVATMQYEAAHPQAEAPVIDERAYDDWAREIAAGDWIGDEVFFQEPLYPYGMAVLYAVFGPERTAVRHAQVGLGALACVLVALLGARLFGRAAGIVAGLGLALYRPAIWLPALLLKENLFLIVLAALALLIVRARTSRGWLAVGVVAALGALLRGNLLVLLPLLLLWPLATARLARRDVRPAVRGAAAVALGVALVLAPVALRNWRVGGALALTTSGAGTNLYGGNNAQNPHGRATEFDWVRGIPEHEAGDWRREAERRTGRALGPTEVSAYWRDEVLRSVREDPALHLSILWNKLRLTLGGYEVPDNHLLAWDARYVPLLRAPLPGFGVLGALGLAGVLLFVLGRRASGAALVLDRLGAGQVAALGLLYLATVVLTVTSARIRIPLVPLLAPFAGLFVVSAWRLARARGRPPASVAVHGACLAVAGLAAWTPVFDAAERAEDLDKREHNLVAQYVEEGRDDEARALLAGLLERYPRSARLRTAAAELDWRAARALRDDPAAARALADGAERALEDVVRRPEVNARERHRADTLLGWIRLSRGDAGGAVEALRRAEAFDADDRDVQLALVRGLVGAARGAGEPGQAVPLLHEALERALVLEARGGQRDGEEDGELALARSSVDLALGEALLERGAEGVEAERARALIADGLKRLQPLATTEDADLRRRARRAAGWTQLYLRNAPSAERHFRAALAVDGSDREAGLGLAQALVARVATGKESGEESGETRAAAAAEARRVLDELAAAGVDRAALDPLRRRLEGE